VKPQQFLKIISNGNNLEKEDFQQLVKLHETFPYFQIPKLLLAKYEYSKTSGNSQEFLHWAAVTSPDRVWLKSFLESDDQLESLQIPLKEKLEEDEKQRALRTPTTQSPGEDDNDDDLIPLPDSGVDPQQRAEILKRLGEKLDQAKRTQKTQPDAEEETPKPKQKSRPKSDGQDLIETIKKRAKREILDEKKKEQIDMIKAFSKREFKLATLKEMENFQKQDDLSKSSTQLNNSLISEPYAKLLLAQGKKHKAKEIYRKLMVKFPDKSSYFAELLKEIEDKN
jgi:hypothetical protein